MLVGNNDQGRIYLNGKEVYKHADVGALEKDSGKGKKSP